MCKTENDMLCLSKISPFSFPSALLVWLQFIVCHSSDVCSPYPLNNSLKVESSSSSSDLDNSLYEKATNARQLNCTTTTLDHGSYHIFPNGTLYVEAINYTLSSSSYSREGDAIFVCKHDMEFKRLKSTRKAICTIYLALILFMVQVGIPMTYFFDWRCIVLSAFVLSLITFSALLNFNMQEIISPFSFFVIVFFVSNFINAAICFWKLVYFLECLKVHFEILGFVRINEREIEVLSFTPFFGIFFYIISASILNAFMVRHIIYVLPIKIERFNEWLDTGSFCMYCFIDEVYLILTCVIVFILRCAIEIFEHIDLPAMIDFSFVEMFLTALNRFIIYFMSFWGVFEYGFPVLFMDISLGHWFLLLCIYSVNLCMFQFELVHLLYSTSINNFLMVEQEQTLTQVTGG